jgi:hypothetical protein
MTPVDDLSGHGFEERRDGLCAASGGASNPKEADPSQDCGQTEKDGRLVPLECPKAALGLIYHQLVEPGGEVGGAGRIVRLGTRMGERAGMVEK